MPGFQSPLHPVFPSNCIAFCPDWNVFYYLPNPVLNNFEYSLALKYEYIHEYIHPGFSMSHFCFISPSFKAPTLSSSPPIHPFFPCIRVKFMTTYSVKPVPFYLSLFVYIYNFYNYWQLTISSFFDHEHLLLALNYYLTGISQRFSRNRTGRMCVYMHIHVHVHTHPPLKLLYIMGIGSCTVMEAGGP